MGETLMQEQKARELELRSFQIAVEGGTLGVMTSFSRIGPSYVGATSGLITDILTNEWGFHGYIVSDMVNPASYMTWKESVIAGTTNFDTTEVQEQWADYMTATSNTFSGDATLLAAIKERVHNIAHDAIPRTAKTTAPNKEKHCRMVCRETQSRDIPSGSVLSFPHVSAFGSGEKRTVWVATKRPKK